MRHLLLPALICAVLLAPHAGGAPVAQTTRFTANLRPADVHDREILVELDAARGAKAASAALSGAGVRKVSTLATSRKRYEVVRVPEGHDYMAALRALESDPAVASVGPNVRKQATAYIPNDPRFLNGAADLDGALERPEVYDSQWGLIVTGAPDAWDVTTGSPSVVVAVIDTGVNLNHTDMQGRWWVNTGEIPGNGQDDDGNGYVDDVNGYDFYTDDGDPTDPSGGAISHGMATSSIVAARMDNNIGMAGIAGGTTAAGGVRVMALRVGTDSDIPVSSEIEAIDYAIDNGADIISMSFGGVSGGQVEEDAIDRAWDAGVLLIAAAGNSGQGNPDGVDLPAGFDNCISVAATTIFNSQGVNNATDVVSERVANYSKSGPENDLAAPGTHIISALSDGSGYTSFTGQEFTGTSAATPVVAGLAALILSADPTLSNAQVRQRMQVNALDLGPLGQDEDYGFGRIRMAQSLPEPVKLGDANGDGSINQADVDAIAARYGAKTGDGNYTESADCNGDGVIDELDVFIVGRQFGK